MTYLYRYKLICIRICIEYMGPLELSIYYVQGGQIYIYIYIYTYREREREYTYMMEKKYLCIYGDIDSIVYVYLWSSLYTMD